MEIIDQVLSQPTGARFYRADLHIHSFGASHDVHDKSMTAEKIVKTALHENLTIIAITDHNEISNVEVAQKAATNTGLYVVPGIELSTSQGHLLCYFPSIQILNTFYGKLTIVDRGQATSRCQQSILECLNITETLGGFCVLAHIDTPTGYDHIVPGASQHKYDVLCHGALLGIELKEATSEISYSKGDPDPERAKIGRERITRLKLGLRQNIARILNSDAHELEFLGHNAQSASKVTRYKMDTPTFEALYIALTDADARVRLEDLIPQSVPRVIGLHIDGGFLHEQVIHFSPNLNCIIGGRGTGKSTAFEAVRCLIGNTSEMNKVVDSEAWPEELYLFFQDQSGQKHSLFRPKDGELQNISNPVGGPCLFEIDCFGQGEAAKISFQAQTDPLALLHYLDRFVNLNEAIIAENNTREQLLTLQTEIEKAEQNVQQIPQFERLLATTKQQLTALQKPDVKEMIELQRKLATEREIRTQIMTTLQDAKRNIGRLTPKTAAETIRTLAEPANLTVGAVEFQAIQNSAAAFEKSVSEAETQIKTGLSTFEHVVSEQITSWKIKESEAQKKIEAKRRELEALKISFDMSYITKLAADEASHSQNIKNLMTWKPHLQELRKKRSAVLKERWAARERVATLRDAFARLATTTLREALSDLLVSLKYTRNAYSPDAEAQIIQPMGGKTNQQVRSNRMVEHLTIPVLIDAIERKDTTPILALQTPENVAVFRREDALSIIERLGEQAIKFALERAELFDLPRLQVTREIPDGKGGTQYLQRDFAKLSLGQQQSVLLALMLSCNSNHPLIIDQPEDNLDGEFIYKTLVPVLRRVKERRQVIIVTHNPNVAVLGDAELIIVMKAMNDHGKIVARGSIDDSSTREATCAILEGAREAFLLRAKMYGMTIS
ncbi:MAG: AAA family ATPase [bacterium]|nr:AAA family ATPase [bacterium]